MELHELHVEEYAGVDRVETMVPGKQGLDRGLGYWLINHLENYCATTSVWPTWIQVLDIAYVITGAYPQLPSRGTREE